MPLSGFMSFGSRPPGLGFRNLQFEILDLKLSEAWSIPHLEGSSFCLLHFCNLPPFGHNVGHNAVGVGFIPFRSPKVGAGAPTLG